MNHATWTPSTSVFAPSVGLCGHSAGVGAGTGVPCPCWRAPAWGARGDASGPQGEAPRHCQREKRADTPAHCDHGIHGKLLPQKGFPVVKPPPDHPLVPDLALGALTGVPVSRDPSGDFLRDNPLLLGLPLLLTPHLEEPVTGEHPLLLRGHPPTVTLSSAGRTKETRTQARVSETCILFLLIVNLFTTNIVKEFSNKTHKNPEDFVFLLCRILRKHHHTARKEILKTNQQSHTWTRPARDPGAAPGVWVIVGFRGRGGASMPPLPVPPSLWDLNGEDKENPDSPQNIPAPCPHTNPTPSTTAQGVERGSEGENWSSQAAGLSLP